MNNSTNHNKNQSNKDVQECKYDIILITGEAFFDHPLSGVAIIKRWLEKNGYSVGIIEMPYSDKDILKLGKPRLFFGVTSGSIDSMLRNYNALKRKRIDDPYDDEVHGYVPDRAVIVYCNWLRQHFKESIIVLGGTEATLRRFTHYDYWDNNLRKPLLVDSRADILSYGNSEKQIIEIADRLKKAYKNLENNNNKEEVLNDGTIKRHKKIDIKEVLREQLKDIAGTCIMSKIIPEKFENKKFIELPSFEAVSNSKEKFCDMQNLFSNIANLAQKVGDRYVLQYKAQVYISENLDNYYELEYTREIPDTVKYLRGFEFSVVTHRGCVGDCNFCSLTLTQGDRIISRSKESIIKEITNITKLPYFRGNIDDLGGPAANMYGIDCNNCTGKCITCNNMIRDDKRMIELLQEARLIPGVEHIYIRSGIRYDLCTPEYLREVIEHHTADTLRIAPEHTDKEVLGLMNKDYGNLNKFMDEFKKINNQIALENKNNNPHSDSQNYNKKELSFYFMTAHPGSTMKHAEELAKFIKHFKNAESVQIFTPTPMTVSTCMYYTGMNPKTKKLIYVPYAFTEKKDQKRVIMRDMLQHDKNLREKTARELREMDEEDRGSRNMSGFRDNRGSRDNGSSRDNRTPMISRERTPFTTNSHSPNSANRSQNGRSRR